MCSSEAQQLVDMQVPCMIRESGVKIIAKHVRTRLPNDQSALVKFRTSWAAQDKFSNPKSSVRYLQSLNPGTYRSTKLTIHANLESLGWTTSLGFPSTDTVDPGKAIKRWTQRRRTRLLLRIDLYTSISSSVFYEIRVVPADGIVEEIFSVWIAVGQPSVLHMLPTRPRGVSPLLSDIASQLAPPLIPNLYSST